MSALLSGITFMQPLILSALLALPVLWYILRITPPAPKTVFFPPMRLLAGLMSDAQTPKKSPWWILLLRLLMAALIIIALARPVMNQADNLAGGGGLRIVIDNSWPSAQSWTLQMQAAEEIIAQAGREKRDIYILPTANPLGQDKPVHYGVLSSGEARSIVRGLKPQPWPADYGAIINLLNEERNGNPSHSIWLSHGLSEGNLGKLAGVLQRQGGLSYVTPLPEKLPLLLRPATKSLSPKEIEKYGDIRINIDAPPSLPAGTPVTAHVQDQDGDIIDAQSVSLIPDELPNTAFFDVRGTLKNKINRFSLAGRRGAGGLFLLDDQFKKRKIGIAAPATSESSTPLIDEAYYIKRALEPFSDITIAEPPELIAADVSVIILPDIAAMPTETLNALEAWVKDGGLLLRFSGPNIAQSRGEQFLYPVLLRSGERSLSGSLSWSEPQAIEVFEENSPFYGLDIPDNITINQQVLADPAQDLDGKVWARLKDGTPFITAKTEDKGLIVLIHTTANTQWSDFSLSGLYVGVLKRIIQLAGNTNLATNHSYTSLDPLLIMDGFGSMITPPAAITPLAVSKLDNFVPDSTHPPGIYGRGHIQYALNIGTHLPLLKAGAPNLPPSVQTKIYAQEYEIDIMPYILYTALILFCLDWVVMIAISGNGLGFKLPRRAGVATFICLTLLTPLDNALASGDRDLRYASGFHLAYIKTGDSALDALTHRGLESLGKTLAARTSVVPKGVAALDPAKDTLSFFPLIYWPIGESSAPPSGKALQNIQSYLDHGGTILFDTRDQNRSTSGFNNTSTARALRQITASLNIPPIAPIPDDHVLGRAFYLLKEYPGRFSTGTLWVEKHSANGRDNVSSVMVGSNDWAGSWADSHGKAAMNRYSANYDAKKQEMALRVGVNLVMYVLTGNYKADQVHIPHILERLGK